MKWWSTVSAISSLALVGAFFSLPEQARAQEPKPPVREYPPLILGRDDQSPSQEPGTDLRPDNRPLTGAQETTMGTQEMRHSYWVPGFQYANLTRSSTYTNPGATNWNSTSYLTGNVSVLDTWSRAQLALNYSGGGDFSADNTQGNNHFHQLGMTQTFSWQRWQLQFIDQFSYLPASQFGFGGASNLSIPGVGGAIAPALPGLQTNYVPNQSIFSAIGPRYNNSFVTQLVYQISPRSSITAAGSYGLLRFVNTGSINSDDVIANLGYNYTLTKNDTIGVLYRFTEFQYGAISQRIDDHVVHAAYGRKVTGRLALQLFGGPDITILMIPVAGTARRISVSGGATLTYAVSRARLSLTYDHSVNGGSGVLLGADTDQISGSLNRRLGRFWQGNVSFGYAKNRNVVQNPAQNSPSFGSYYAGVGLDRPLGRYATFSLGYTAYIQGASQSICTPGTCSASYTQHQISIGFTWRRPPYVLR
jgi:hypothetical protein